MIPLKFKLIASALAFLLIIIFAYRQGANAVQAEWDIQKAAAIAAASEIKDKRNAVSNKIDAEHAKASESTRVIFKTITKEVPVYVTKAADSSCVVTNGFVLLHDAAAKGSVPGAASESNDAPAGIDLSTVAETITENYGTYAEVRQRLIDLQNWVIEQEAINAE